MKFSNQLFLGVLALNFVVSGLSQANENYPQAPQLLSQNFRQPINFKLPDRGAPGSREDSAGSRGNCRKEDQLTALVPPRNFGYTVSARPTFWFNFTSNQSSSLPAEFLLLDDQNKNIVKLTLSIKPGLIKVDLPANSALTETEKFYSWKLKVICDSNDPTAIMLVSGEIAKKEIDQNLQSQIQGKQGRDLAIIYAANSIWFDALKILAELREKEPNNPVYREDWNKLLNSVGLQD